MQITNRPPVGTPRPRKREKSHAPLRRDALLISRYDRTRLLRLLGSLPMAGMSTPRLADLEFEVERATPVRSKAIPQDVVTMNSSVRVTDTETGASQVCSIVFPAHADEKAGLISVLEPVGTALLGYRAGDTVRVVEGGRETQLRIDEIIYQPEAAGDFHL